MFEDKIHIKKVAYPMYVDYFTINSVEIVFVEEITIEEEEYIIATIQVERLETLINIGLDIGSAGFPGLIKYLRVYD